MMSSWPVDDDGSASLPSLSTCMRTQHKMK